MELSYEWVKVLEGKFYNITSLLKLIKKGIEIFLNNSRELVFKFKVF